MLDNSLDSILKKKWRFLSGHILPIFAAEKSQTKEVEPCSLISSRTWKDYDLPDLAFVFSGVTPEVKQEDLSDNNSIENASQTPPARKGWKRFAGILLALFATFIYSLATLIIKVFKDYHPFVLSIWRFQGMIIPSIPVLLFYIYGEKKRPFESVWPLTQKTKVKAVFFIFMRSVLGCTATALQIFAVQKMNMADASIIVYSSPVFVTLAAHIFLGEKSGIFAVLTAIFTLSGVVVIARPPMLTGTSLDTDTLIGTIYAIASMLLSAFVYVILRYLRDVHYSVITIMYGVFGTIECVIVSAILDVFALPNGLWEWILAATLILFTFLGQTAVVLSLQYENAGPISLVGTTDVVFAFLWQFLFLSVLPDPFSLMGASIVILGVLLTTYRRWIITLPENDKTRIRMAWFLK